ncbi:Actin-66 (Fragment) [Seminavis robusta]|uniref:Actin-66 n=1 Tax=Seminavis robusta TaxID=568900 RepID=A0A9N8DAJ5_9STRA
MSSEAGAEGGGEAGGGLLLNQPVVIDNGSSTIKAGFAGGSKPKVVIGTKVGRAKHMRIMPGGALEADKDLSGPSSIFVGRKLDEHRGAFLLEYPMDKGYVSDGGWDAMERLWEHVYAKNNLNAKIDDHPVLMTEAPLNPRTNRDKTAEIFFETFRSPAMFFTPPSVLSLYASGRTTGVVLDVGEGVTHAVPVYEGFALPHSVTRSDVAGRDVTRQMQLLLRRSGLPFTTTAEVDLVKSLKEEVCYCTPNPTSANDEVAEKESKTQYQLPDGQAVSLASERFQAPNVLFDPFLFGSEEAGVADVLVTSIMKSDIDLRSKLYSQIVLAGGSTLFQGFGDRMLYEVRSRSPSHTRIRISAPPERLHSAYVGGSILASLATFKSMWVSRADYEEHGSAILHRADL